MTYNVFGGTLSLTQLHLQLINFHACGFVLVSHSSNVNDNNNTIIIINLQQLNR